MRLFPNPLRRRTWWPFQAVPLHQAFSNLGVGAKISYSFYVQSTDTNIQSIRGVKILWGRKCLKDSLEGEIMIKKKRLGKSAAENGTRIDFTDPLNENLPAHT